MVCVEWKWWGAYLASHVPQTTMIMSSFLSLLMAGGSGRARVDVPGGPWW